MDKHIMKSLQNMYNISDDRQNF